MELKQFHSADISAPHYPPILQFKHMGTGPPLNLGSLQLTHRGYFNQYRDDSVSRMRVSYDDCGLPKSVYTPSTSNARKKSDFLNFPQSEISMLDAARQQEVDNFYMACQMYRDQYKDHTSRLHPLNYFKRSDYMYQCPEDPTSVYMKCPINYAKYKNPLAYPLTMGRTFRLPTLPNRILTGTYNRTSFVGRC